MRGRRRTPVGDSDPLREPHARLFATHQPHFAGAAVVAQQVEALGLDQRVVAVLVEEFEPDAVGNILQHPDLDHITGADHSGSPLRIHVIELRNRQHADDIGQRWIARVLWALGHHRQRKQERDRQQQFPGFHGRPRS